MARDKKVESGQLRLVLLTGLGQSVVTGDFSASALEETLEEASNSAA
jgi:3-dehydroquinate synthase